MSVACVMAQRAQQSGLQTLVAVPCHLVILSNTVRMPEIQLQRLAAEQIGVLLDRLHRPRPKSPEHLHSPAGANLELSKIGDQLPHAKHPLELLLDAVCFVRRYTGDGRQTGRVICNDIQSRCAKGIDDLIRSSGSNIRQRAAGQKGIDRLQIPGHIGLTLLGVELAAIGRVVLVPAAADHGLSSMQFSHHAAHHRDHTPAGDLKHGIAAV